MGAVAAEAGVAAGLLHHHFENKQEMLEALLQDLLVRFRARVKVYDEREHPLIAYVDGALKLDGQAGVLAAKCWVGVFAEAVRNPHLFRKARSLIDTEMGAIRRRSGGRISDGDAGAILAFIVGALVVGAFAPKKTAGFAAPALRRFLRAFDLSLGPDHIHGVE